MQKTGVRWEDVTVDNISVEDLDAESLKIFRREALRSKRMTEAELNVSDAELLSKLKLLSNGKLKRSAVLLFYSDPSIVQNGSYVKIGKFGDKGTVEYHDDLEESLINTADKIVDLIYLKYLKAKITYEHDRRVETYPFARNAIREAIYNAIAHNCYMFGTPIQIRIEEDPVYELVGNSIRVHFKALQSALINHLKTPNRQDVGKRVGLEVSLAERILELIKENPDKKMSDMAEELKVTQRTVEREIKKLREAGHIERVGGKRYGYWKIKQ